MTSENPISAPRFFRMSLLRAAGKHPDLYYTLFRFSRSYRREDLVQPETDICIEGPPGSGNTYVVTAFTLANPEARIGHHHHVPAQLHRARQLGTPAVSLLRDPIDCAMSRASSWGTPKRSDLVLKQWLDYFADESLIEYSLLVGFQTLTSSPQIIIAELNRRFGTAFVSALPSRETVFREMDRRRLELIGTVNDNPNRPDRRRAKPPETWRPYIEGLPRAAEASRRYSSLVSSAL